MTTNSKHTPGPWTVGGSLISAPTTTIARALRRPAVYGGMVYETNDTDRQAPKTGAETDANARLIAAAPAMYDALRRIVAARDDLADGAKPATVGIGVDQAYDDWAADIAAAALRQADPPAEAAESDEGAPF